MVVVVHAGDDSAGISFGAHGAGACTWLDRAVLAVPAMDASIDAVDTHPRCPVMKPVLCRPSAVEPTAYVSTAYVLHMVVFLVLDPAAWLAVF